MAAPGSVEVTAAWLASTVRDGDAVLVMGGGRSYRIAELLLERPGGTMTLTYAQGHDLLEALVRARKAYDGDRWVDLFADHAEVVLDPFASAAGRAQRPAGILERRGGDRALLRSRDRAALGRGGHGPRRLARQLEPPSADEATKVRQAGFLAAEVGGDGRIARLRHWAVTREHSAGQEGAR